MNEKNDLPNAVFERPGSLDVETTENGAGMRAMKNVESGDVDGRAPRFPTDAAELKRLETVAYLGGSTGAKKVRAPDGGEYVLKRGGTAGGDAAGHLRNECVADAFYRALKIDVPEFRVYETDGGPVKLSLFMDGGRSLGDWWKDASPSERAAMREKLRRGLAVDVALGNWDVVGLDADNARALVDENGETRPWRVDNGGALGFRAQGARKRPEQWGDRAFIDELWTMTGRGADVAQNAPTNVPAYFGEVKPLDLAEEIAAIDWNEAMKTLPDADRKAFETRLRRARKLAELRRRLKNAGCAKEYADEILARAYAASRNGLLESPRFQTARSNGGDAREFRRYILDASRLLTEDF